MTNADDHDDDTSTGEVAFPLDASGYLRRACPACEREFKRVQTDEDAEELGCPYCGQREPSDVGSWLTSEQLEHFEHAALTQGALGASLGNLFGALDRLSTTASGKAPATPSGFEAPPPIVEVDDMRAVALPCHPLERVKVLDGWTGDVRCTVCGTVAPA